MGWLGVRGNLHREHVCTLQRQKEQEYRQGKGNSNSTTGCRLLMIQEIVLLFCCTCGLFVSIPSVLLFSHLLYFPYHKSNKVPSPLPCSTSPVFPLCVQQLFGVLNFCGNQQKYKCFYGMGYLKLSKNSEEMKEWPISVCWLLFCGSHFPIQLPGEIPSQLSCLAVAGV